jgi:hypothetical protein
VPPTIDSTGVTDVTTQLLQFISATPDGSTIQFRAGGRYRIDGTLDIHDRHDLTFAGNGATLFAGTRGDAHRAQFWFFGGGPIAIHDLTVTGANSDDFHNHPDWEWQHGLAFSGVQGVAVTNVTVKNVYGDFVYLGHDGPKAERWTSDVTIQNSQFDRNGRQGVSMISVRNVTVRNNSFSNVHALAFDIEPMYPSDGVLGVTITGNRVSGGNRLLSAAGAVAPVRDVALSNNSLVGVGLFITLQTPPGIRRGPFSFTGNKSDTRLPQGPSVRLLGVDGAVIQGNQAPIAGRTAVAISVRESCAVTVADNTFDGAARLIDTDAWPCPPPAAPDSRGQRTTTLSNAPAGTVPALQAPRAPAAAAAPPAPPAPAPTGSAAQASAPTASTQAEAPTGHSAFAVVAKGFAIVLALAAAVFLQRARAVVRAIPER